MFFYVQGPNKHDLLPLELVFKRADMKTEATKAAKDIDADPLHGVLQKTLIEKHILPEAENAYRSIENLPQEGPALQAWQIMSRPVISLSIDMSIDYALKLLQKKQLRHLPVVSANGKVIGMVSDRDVFQYMANLFQQKTSPPHKTTDRIQQLMRSPVLTASLETDIRYIARLFVEQRVGAMPIVADGELNGIVTRSDILHAVMNHYQLELWI